MKIFNTENNINKVYVHPHDLCKIFDSDIKVPDSIFMKFFNENVVYDFNFIFDNNNLEFIEFDTKEELEFFKSLNWIIDYKELIKLTEEEIKNIMNEISNEIDEMADKYNSMGEIEKENNISLYKKCDLLTFKLKSINEILLFKQNKKEIELPLVPNSDGFSFAGDDECEYEIRESLDPTKNLLFRKDGKPLSNNEQIPITFVDAGMSIALMEFSKNNGSKDYDINMSRYISDDRMYIITSFNYNNYEVKNKKEEMIDKPKVNGIKGFIKSLFSNKK